VARFLPSGALDTSFGTGGQAIAGPATGIPTDIVRAPDGTITVSGIDEAADFPPGSVIVARFTQNGQPAADFGMAGAVTTRAGFGDARAFGLTVTSDGRPLVAASLTSSFSGPQLSLLRFTPNGGLDPSFGSGGVKRADFGSGTSSYGNDVALQGDGLVVVTGHVSISHGNSAIGVARFLP
jgi:uncharacterized delta-60 repeat protein